jgi:hypothetical protein
MAALDAEKFLAEAEFEASVQEPDRLSSKRLEALRPMA